MSRRFTPENLQLARELVEILTIVTSYRILEQILKVNAPNTTSKGAASYTTFFWEIRKAQPHPPRGCLASSHSEPPTCFTHTSPLPSFHSPVSPQRAGLLVVCGQKAAPTGRLTSHTVAWQEHSALQKYPTLGGDERAPMSSGCETKRKNPR